MNEMGELLEQARHGKWEFIEARHLWGRIGTGDEINEMVVNFTTISVLFTPKSNAEISSHFSILSHHGVL